MESVAEHLGQGAHRADRSRVRRRILRLIGMGAIVVVLFVGFGLAFPRTVPRLAIFPAPPTRVTYDTCNGQRGAKTTERWERSGPFWTSARFRIGGGCIDQ